RATRSTRATATGYTAPPTGRQVGTGLLKCPVAPDDACASSAHATMAADDDPAEREASPGAAPSPLDRTSRSRPAPDRSSQLRTHRRIDRSGPVPIAFRASLALAVVALAVFVAWAA